MDPMYLPDVEQRRRDGPFAERIAAMQPQGLPVPQIWHLFAFKPDVTGHLARSPRDHARPVAAVRRVPRTDRRVHVPRNDCPF